MVLSVRQNYLIKMKVDQMHQKLVSHYIRARSKKTKKNIQVQSIVGQNIKKKTQQREEMSPLQDFLRNQKQISVEENPLLFRELPRKLKVHFPGPPEPPPKLIQTPYTYQIVPLVRVKTPKQKPGYVGNWVLDECQFVERKPKHKKGNKSIEVYRIDKNDSFQNSNLHESRQKFRSQIRRIAGQMKEKNLSLKQIIKNKGFIKKPHNFYNSEDFFLMAKTGDKDIQHLLESNVQLAFDVDQQQMTGLHWAAREGHPYVCKILLQKYRANVLAKDCYGRTPLHLAVMNRNYECIIRIFIEGGTLGIMNKDKKSVRMVAPDPYTKYLLEKLEEIKFIIKSKGLKRQQQRQLLQSSVRGTLDQSSLYF